MSDEKKIKPTPGCSCSYCKDAVHDKPEPPILASDMTLRDYFAGQVLAGTSSLEMDGEYCYKVADEMIEARKK